MTIPADEKTPAWMWPNHLGLDAPAVAVTWQWLFARGFGIGLPAVYHLILGLSVWCIYLADRLYDARRAPESASGTSRLAFTRRHFSALALVTAIAGCSNLFLIIRNAPRQLIFTGLITAGLLVIYYMIRLEGRARISAVIPREFLCGMLFALGTVIAPHAFAPPGAGDVRFYAAAIPFGLVCSASCVLISIWEKEADLASNDRSAATDGAPFVPHIGEAVIALALVSALQAIHGTWQIHLAVSCSSAALWVMLRFDNRIPTPALRALADAVLLTPLVFVWF